MAARVRSGLRQSVGRHERIPCLSAQRWPSSLQMWCVVFDSSGSAIHSQGQSAARMDSRCSCDSRTCVDRSICAGTVAGVAPSFAIPACVDTVAGMATLSLDSPVARLSSAASSLDGSVLISGIMRRRRARCQRLCQARRTSAPTKRAARSPKEKPNLLHELGLKSSHTLSASLVTAPLNEVCTNLVRLFRRLRREQDASDVALATGYARRAELPLATSATHHQ